MMRLIERLRRYTDFDNSENQNMPIGLRLMEEATAALDAMNVECAEYQMAITELIVEWQSRIDALKAQVPAWIKCSDKLPDEDGAYMTFDGEDVGEAFYTKAGGFRWLTGLAAKIEYWSELPAPPTTQREEG